MKWISRCGFAAVMVATVILSTTSSQAQDAKGVYQSKCAMCHGADGKGDTAIGKKTGVHDFASAEVQKQSDADLQQITKKGKNKMPAYDGKLKDSEIKELVAYLRQLGKKQ